MIHDRYAEDHTVPDAPTGSLPRIVSHILGATEQAQNAAARVEKLATRIYGSGEGSKQNHKASPDLKALPRGIVGEVEDGIETLLAALSALHTRIATLEGLV